MPHGSGGWGLLSVVCSQGVGPALLRFLKTKEPGGKEGPGGGITLPGSSIAGSSRTTRILSYNGIPTQHSFFEILRRVALWRAQYDDSCKHIIKNK